MAKQSMSIEAKKDFAKLLYTREQLDAKVVAERVGVTEKTVGRWVADGDWKKLRTRLLVTKQQQLDLIYDQIENLNRQIAESEQGFADSKQADIMVKYATTIRTLENDLGMGEIIDVGIMFIKHIQAIASHETTLQVMELWQSFVATKQKG